MKFKSLVFYSIVFVVAVFTLHILYFQSIGIAWNSHLLLHAYLINILVVVFILVAIRLLPQVFGQAQGQIFLGGSALKFLLFFVIFYPSYKNDGELTRLEFFSFFVPYAICLASETLLSIKLINKK